MSASELETQAVIGRLRRDIRRLRRGRRDMKQVLTNALVVVFVLLIVISVILGFVWLFWLLWCWVLPQVWADGPASVVRPNYWLFLGAWTLVSMIGRAVFGGRK